MFERKTRDYSCESATVCARQTRTCLQRPTRLWPSSALLLRCSHSSFALSHFFTLNLSFLVGSSFMQILLCRKEDRESSLMNRFSRWVPDIHQPCLDAMFDPAKVPPLLSLQFCKWFVPCIAPCWSNNTRWLSLRFLCQSSPPPLLSLCRTPRFISAGNAAHQASRAVTIVGCSRWVRQLQQGQP